jgi:N-acetylneuraminic acid mutarotase
MAAYDGGAVLFGGFEYNGLLTLGDTWTWGGSAWTQESPAASPPAREGAAALMLNGTPTLFGGEMTDGAGDFALFSDMWTWNGTTWAELGATGPSGRSNATVAVLGSKVVLFGGANDNALTAMNDTWVWDGSGWTAEHPTSAPSPRSRAMMAAVGGKLVLFGGLNAAQTEALADTWIWDGASWTELNPATAPSARFGGVMATP